MKRFLPVAVAGIVFLMSLLFLRPAPAQTVVVAAVDLPAGHVLTDADLIYRDLPADGLPDDAITDLADAVGQTLRIDRGKGDVLRASQLGEMIRVQPDERAIAVRVSDPSGLAGMLRPGNLVGLVATLSRSDYEAQGSFSKAAVEGLRVLYIDPRFAASAGQDLAQPTPDALLAGVNTQDRAREGTVILAVPTSLQTLIYDFAPEGGISETRKVNALELLAALNETDGASVTLYLMPQGAEPYTSPGLWLPDLIITPAPTPTPTPTATPSAGGH